VDYLRGQESAIQYLESREQRLQVCALTVAELYAGVRPGRELASLETFLRAFTIIPVDREIAVKSGAFRSKFGKSHGVGLADAVIAATAACTGAVLVTLNNKHFPMLSEVQVPYKK
jgi:predicted nucleic acid-binding protein